MTQLIRRVTMYIDQGQGDIEMNDYTVVEYKDSELLGQNHIVSDKGDGLIYITAKIVRVFGSKAFGMMADLEYKDGSKKHGLPVECLKLA